MPIGKDYRLTIGAGREELPPAEDREGATFANLSPEPAAVYEALKLIPGAEEIPGLGDFVACAYGLLQRVQENGHRVLPRHVGRRSLRRLH